MGVPANLWIFRARERTPWLKAKSVYVTILLLKSIIASWGKFRFRKYFLKTWQNKYYWRTISAISNNGNGDGEMEILYQKLQHSFLVTKIAWPKNFLNFNPIKDGGGTKRLSPVTSTKAGISRQNFWLLFLTLLPRWWEISSWYLVPVPNYYL